jgi:glycosyltransferase involved in cell wall biosynthesis
LAHPHPRFPKLGFLRQLHSVNRQLMQGDFFLCANDRQKDYWLGALGALGRLNPNQYASDASFRGLVGIVPFGMSSQPPRKQRSAIRDAIPAIRPGDTVLLWAGGIWDWLDPLVIIKAVGEISKTRSDIKLVFLGTRDPNSNNRTMSMLERCKAESKALGALDQTVFFLEGWVPYDERQDYLLDADIGVSAHPDTIESRFSFRTRLLDYLWAGLPMIVSQGDGFSEYIADKQLGVTVPMGDVSAWQTAILALVDDVNGRAAIRRRIAELAPNFRWSTAAAPLVDYCNHPYRGNSVPRLRKILAPALIRLYESWRRLQSTA